VVGGRIGAATSEASRRLLHRKSAIVLEAEVTRDTPIELAWACARHWEASRQASRGLRVLLTAAAHLVEIGSPGDALQVYEEAARLCSTPQEETDLLRRRARTLGLTGRWFEAVHMWARIMEHQRNIASAIDWAADSVEALNADVRANGYDLQKALRAMDVSAQTTLPPTIRLDAAAIGLKIATNLGDATLAGRVWATLQHFSPATQWDEARHRHLAVLFHHSFGDLEQGALAARQLDLLIQQGALGAEAIPALINLADAARVRGDRADAARYATDAHSRATRLSATFLAVRAADKLAVISIEDREADSAERWLAEARSRAVHQDAETTVSLNDTAARLLLLKGQYVDAFAVAMSTLTDFRRFGPTSGHPFRTHITTAAEAHLASDGGPLQQSLLDELRQVHLDNCTQIFHDRTVAVLCTALARTGDDRGALDTLETYLSRDRRGSRFLPEQLRALRDSLHARVIAANP
jgi:hypothetical protein